MKTKEKYFKLCEQCKMKCKMKGIGELTWCPHRVPKSLPEKKDTESASRYGPSGLGRGSGTIVKS